MSFTQSYKERANRWRTFLDSCGGIEKKLIAEKNWKGEPEHKTYYYRTDEDIVIPPDQWIRINNTATKGTLAKLVDVEVEEYNPQYSKVSGQISDYSGTFIYESLTPDGVKKKGRINKSYAELLDPMDPDWGKMQYVRKVKEHKKEEVKNPVNKFGQELQKGDWVVGAMSGKRLGIGRITRWTNHNVWGTRSDDLDDKRAEFKFDTIKETFLMPNDDHVSSLTMAVLKGWDGR